MSFIKKILVFPAAVLLVLAAVELGSRVREQVCALTEKNRTVETASVNHDEGRAYCVLVLGGRVDGRGDDLSLAFEMEETLARLYPDMPVRVVNRAVTGTQESLFDTALKYISRYHPDCVVFITADGNGSLRRIPDGCLFSPDTLDGVEFPFDVGQKKDEEFYFGRADALMDRGFWASAYLVFAAALIQYPENDDFYVGTARCLRECEVYERAAGFLDHALAVNPDHTGALVEYGLLFQARNDIQRAEEFLERAWDMDNDSERACFSLARFYLKRGYVQKLALLVDRVKELSSEWGTEFVELGGEIPDEADVNRITADTWLKKQYLRPETEVSGELESLVGLLREHGIVSVAVPYPLTCGTLLKQAFERVGGDIYLSVFDEFVFNSADEEDLFDADFFMLTREGTRTLALSLARRLEDRIKSHFSRADS